MSKGEKAVRRYTEHALHNALALADAGVYVFPIGLKPDHRTEHGWKLRKVYYKKLAWSTEATRDPDKVRELFGRFPGSAVGVATGPSQLAVPDRDDLQAELPGALPETFTYATARGDRHHWYRTPEGMEVKSQAPFADAAGRKYPGLDLKSWGGMVVYYGPKLKGGELDDLPTLPDAYAVSRELERPRDEHAPRFEQWLDSLRAGKPGASLRALAEAVPTANAGNDDLTKFFGPLVRAAWNAKGGRAAIEEGIARYSDGYGSKARKDARHAIESVVRDYRAEIDSRVTFDPAPRESKPKPGKGKGAEKGKAKGKLAHEEYTPRGEITSVSSPTSPLEVAHEILADKTLPPLVSWQDSWFCYADGHWKLTPADEIENRLYHALRHASFAKRTEDGVRNIPFAPTHTKVREVLRSIQALVTIPAEAATPMWLDGREDTTRLIACRDGLLDPRAGTLQPRSRHYFTPVHVAAKFGKASTPTHWLGFLDDLYGDDPTSRHLLQEWMGYLVSGDTRRHKGMLMIGPRRSGKGTILRVCEALVGGAAGSFATSIPAFSESFGLEGVEGKSLLTLGDLRGSGREAASAAQKLLEIIGGDTVRINRKGRPAISQPIPARVMVASNSVPTLYDDAAVIESRFLILTMTRSFAGAEDLDLFPKLEDELDGILRWALKGYRRLERRGAFSVPEADTLARAELRVNAAPVSEFVDDACVPAGPEDPGTPRTDMWAAYCDWCAETGAAQMDRGDFTRALAGAGYPSYRPRTGDGSRGVWRYRGLTLTQAETPEQRAVRIWGGAAGLGIVTSLPR